jgi:hypothetical protein
MTELNKYKSDIWIIGVNKYLFPEIENKMYNPEGVGISISGGGNRSLVSMMGYFRAMNKLMIDGERIFNKTQFISSISGGSWFIGIYLLAGYSISEDILLGDSYGFNKLGKITIETLEKFNSTNSNYYIGKRATNSDFLKYLVEGLMNGIVSNELWNYIIGKIYLEPYNCFDKPISLNNTDAIKIFDITKQIPCIIRPKSPFWIVNTTLIYENTSLIKEFNTFQFTPIYSGMPNIIQTNNSQLGGMWQSTYSFDSYYPDNLDLTIISEKQEVFVNKKKYFTIENMMGISSSAYCKYLYEENLFGKYIDLIPKYNIWVPNNTTFLNNDNNLLEQIIINKTNEYYLTDGGILNNNSILSLLQRKVKKIILFNSTEKIIDKSSYLNETWKATNLYSFFELENKLQVFKQDDWEIVAQNLITNSNKGGPMYTINTLKVLPNKEFYIEGNYSVDLLIIILQPSTNFNNLLPSNITNTFDDINGPYPFFPNYPTIFTNPGKLIELTNGQVNLLSTYTDWSITETELANIILNMYK